MNDDELLARLRAADPAQTSSAPPPDIDRLVEAALTIDTTPRPETTTTGSTTRPAPAAAGRRRLFGLAAAAALLLAGGGIAAGITAGGDSAHPSASAPLTLTVASGTADTKCMEPTPDSLRGYPTLFGGTATSVKGSSVTFRVDHWFRGGDSKTVRLNSDPDQPETLTFTVGEHYIVAATKDGTVPPCAANMASDETLSRFRQASGQ
ncbi:hypothetical protein EDD90_0158 [Streptomyces sp. Ag109_O5-1]|uniref:hypothetical protein n=1 Tax=Streptomyces TaxID=1883 RepID=UPI000F50E86A|nr:MULTISPECIES: hypothetical protein [Streptomyces]RPE37331.1 hypothetical protein EDD90_0158 [Streptomyces sp. Ag109_O5-1]